MAEAIQNSFSELIENFITLQNNAFLVLQKISESVTTEADSISFALSDIDGETDIEYSIPSYGYLKNYMNRIDNTISAMLGLADGTQATIKNADGSYSVIYTVNLRKEPEAITTVNIPTTFAHKPNWFFEDYLNPYLYINVDITKYTSSLDKRVMVRRIIVDCQELAAREYFINNFKDKNNIFINDMMSKLKTEGIGYTVDEEIKDLPPLKLKYKGVFDVLDWEDYKEPNGRVVTTKRRYKFNKITFSDNGSTVLDSNQLYSGAKLQYKDSIYEVENIDKGTYYVTLKRISGLDPITKLGTLTLFSDVEDVKYVQVGISPNEFEVIFFKSINEENNIISAEWSNGIGFYTNDLTIQTASGNMTLSEYYADEVYDYGIKMKGDLRENQIPAYYAEKPNAPVITADNFKVVQINNHLYDNKEVEEIKDRASEKIKLETELAEINKSISDKKSELYNSDFSNKEVDRQGIVKTLNKLISQRASTASDYASVVKFLNSKKTDNISLLSDPKFRIRGFFNIPAPKYNVETGLQEIIQFEIAYQYKSEDGPISKTDQFDYTSAQSQSIEGTFTNWNFVKSTKRTKHWDEKSGIYVWDDVDISDPEVIKPNQVDIPISKGESVLIKIRSISEAGDFNHEVFSEWSETITVDFPENIQKQDESKIALDNIAVEAVKVEFEDNLNAKGLDVHLSDSTYNQDQYWSHDAKSISSGFYKEGIIQSLFDKLNEMQKTIDNLQAQIQSKKAVMKVSIISDDGTEQVITNGSVASLFAGYYIEEQEKLPESERVGAIIRKKYSIKIENVEGSVLELCSQYPGDIEKTFAEIYGDKGDNSINNDPKWKKRSYDQVPIINAIRCEDLKDTSRLSQINYQSPQLLSQFIYLRKYDITGMHELYVDTVHANDDQKTNINVDEYLSIVNDSNDEGKITNIWGGFKSGDDHIIKKDGVLSEFCVHTDCPILDVNNNKTQWSNYSTENYNENIKFEEYFTDPKAVYSKDDENISPTGTQNVPAFAVNENVYAKKGNESFVPQTTLDYSYIDNNRLVKGVYPNKLGFYNHERYMIGEKTCGSYFYVALTDVDQIRTGGVDYISYYTLEAGQSIIIPLVFEYRMQDYYERKGIYGGYDGTNKNMSSYSKNFTYARRLGFDIYQNNAPLFSFDVEVQSKCEKSSQADEISKSYSSVTKPYAYRRQITPSYIKNI